MNESVSHSGTALITGASSGFGLLISVRLARAGYHVLATMRNPESKGRLLEAAERAGVSNLIDVRKLDVTDADSIAQTIQYAVNAYSSLDVLVNNAGYAAGGFTEEVPLSAWKDQFDTNVFGLLAVTQAVVPHMRQQRRGCIINISSISGRIGFPAMGPYVASKHAVEGLSESLRLELKPYGVHVVLVEPASYRTDIWQKGLQQTGDFSQSAYRFEAEKLARGVNAMANAGGDPNEVAELVYRIVTSSRPKFRYPIGRGARGLDRAKRWLPWSWIEHAISNRLSK